MIVRQHVPRLGLILPAYNEEEVLKTTLTKLKIIRSEMIKAGKITDDSFIMFVDDGSKDRTWPLIREAQSRDQNILGVKLSRNFGHQSALLAGMTEANKLADAVITLDADLQDSPNVISEMVDRYNEGYDIVYGVRSSRKKDTWFKRNTAMAFYKLAGFLGVEIIPNHADFRLMSKVSVDALLALPERNVFLRAMVPLLGYPSTEVFYERGVRNGGKTKYPLKKMLSFAVDGITSFSVKPIRFLFDLGVLVVGIAGVQILYTLVQKMLGHAQAGWSSLMISIWLLGGLNLVAIGVVGIYIGKIFTEVKQRPRFQIENVAGNKAPNIQKDVSIYDASTEGHSAVGN
ncbi:glycosyltransferase family 2 protein [Leuconostocaceae bacterium ESL0723]|nr:glycosyltransferase family 2 protein [Lactobacillaceae bacterium L1_55_11]WEV53949.1 glycosyltransferase family 2 protein [Leuconostocaceae bacterium ESL0723]